MGEIRPNDIEWMVIERMGKMLKCPHRGFMTVATYCNFSSILCWTVERIRTNPVNPNTDLGARNVPQDDPNFDIFDAIQLDMLEKGIQGFFNRLPKATGCLNDLHTKDNEGSNITALAFAIALRNAVAHGDGRSVKPVNRKNRLVGFEFSLKNPNKFPQWSCQTQLNRRAMRQIAGRMVDVFCEKFRNAETRS